MALTFKELKRELDEALGKRSDLQSRMGSFINIAQDRIARKYEFSELTAQKSVTIGTLGTSNENKANDRHVYLPDNFRDIHSVILVDGANSKKLKFVPSRQWDNICSIEQQFLTGRPSTYTIFEKQLLIWKIPDQAYNLELRYSKWPTKLTEDDQVSDFDHKDDLLITASTLWALQSLGEIERSNHIFAIFKTLIEEVINYDQSKVDQTISPFNGTGRSNKPTDPFYFGDNY